MRRVHPLAWVCLLALAGCDDTPGAAPMRGAAGKADDNLGTCTPDDCGGPARDGNGYCDSECAALGDCAANIVLACDLNECSGAGEASIGCDGGGCDDGRCAEAPAWGLNDVSVLFPAGDDDVGHLLKTTNDRDGGSVSLLDEALFNRLGVDAPFLTETPGRDQHFDKLRLFSARLDPCVEGRDPHAPDCERAVRLVLQPAWPLDEGFDIYDASIHLFYEMDDARWNQLLADYTAIRTTDLSTAPLQVHPVLAAEGVDGVFGQALHALIVDVATPDAMTQMTFMATGRSGNNWFWGGFKRQDDGSFAELELPGAVTKTDFISTAGTWRWTCRPSRGCHRVAE